jgi:hypothetical protein
VATRGASAAPATGWLCVRAHGDRGVVAVVSSCLCGWQALVRVGTESSRPAGRHTGARRRRDTRRRGEDGAGSERKTAVRVRARGDGGGGTCTRKHPSLARRPASPAAARRQERHGVIAMRLGSKAGSTTDGRGSFASPWWPRADVQAAVKRGGARSSAWKETAARSRGSRGVAVLGFAASSSSHVRSFGFAR